MSTQKRFEKLAQSEFQEGNFKSAKEYGNLALNSCKNDRDRAILNHFLGIISFNEHSYLEAKNYFGISIKSNYKKSESLNFLALIAKSECDKTLCEKLLHKSIKSNKANIAAVNNLANLLIENDDYLSAKEILEKAALKNKKNALLRYNLSKLYSLQGEKDISNKMYGDYVLLSFDEIFDFENNKSLKFFSSQSQAQTILESYVYSITLKDQKEKISNLEKLLLEAKSIKDKSMKTDSVIYTIMVRIANSFLDLKDYQKALNMFESASSINQNNETVEVNKGICLSHLDRRKEAIDCFKKAAWRKDRSGISALCNLANMAAISSIKEEFLLYDPKEYFKFVLKNIDKESFNTIDESKYNISEAVISQTNSNLCYIFRRAKSSKHTLNLLKNENLAIKKFHEVNNQYNLKLNIVNPIAVIENIKGFDTHILSRCTGEELLSKLVELKSDNNNEAIKDYFLHLSKDLPKIRLIGNLIFSYPQNPLLKQSYSLSYGENTILLKKKILDKFIGGEDYRGSLYNVCGVKNSQLVEFAIESNYLAVSGLISDLSADFYKDVSLKNVIANTPSLEHIDFEELRNLPFAFEVANALNMGDFVIDKDEIIDNIYEGCGSLSEKLNIKLPKLGSLEEFTIHVHAAGVHRGLIHHASFIDWKNRLNKPHYGQLAKDTLINTINDLSWIKANAELNSDDNSKINALEDALSTVYQ